MHENDTKHEILEETDNLVSKIDSFLMPRFTEECGSRSAVESQSFQFRDQMIKYL